MNLNTLYSKISYGFAVRFKTVCVDHSNSKKFRSMFENHLRYASLVYTYEIQRTYISHAEHGQDAHLFQSSPLRSLCNSNRYLL